MAERSGSFAGVEAITKRSKRRNVADMRHGSGTEAPSAAMATIPPNIKMAALGAVVEL